MALDRTNSVTFAGKGLRAALAAAMLAAAPGCGSGGDHSGAVAGESVAPAATGNVSVFAGPTLNTFINNSLEIDQLGSGVTPDDANLFVGADPADMTASAQKPTGGPATFIDWNNLGNDLSNHRLLDLNGSDGRDATSFPRSNECVAGSHVLSKMDLTYVAAANNGTYAYFGVQRSDNNGDAGYYWLFTKVAPSLIQGQAPCHSDEQRLVYTITGPTMGDAGNGTGDVLLAGHFHPNGSPLLRIFHATHNATNVTAVDAVDFTSSLWHEDSGSIAAVAVNTTITAPGAFGSAGVGALKGANLDKEIFAEAAVALSAFTSGSSCGATYYGSVITRSSGSGGTSPDLKDLAGPALFNFGGTTAEASMTGKCDLSADFAVSNVKGPDGSTPMSYTCLWTFDDNTTSSNCSGNHVFSTAGTHTASVVVDAGGCSTGNVGASTSVATPITVSLTLSGTAQSCPGMTSDAVTYTANASGGPTGGTLNLTWHGPTCSGSTCTIDPSDGTFCDTEHVYVTASDPSGFCPSKDSETEDYTKVTTITASDK